MISHYRKFLAKLTWLGACGSFRQFLELLVPLILDFESHLFFVQISGLVAFVDDRQRESTIVTMAFLRDDLCSITLWVRLFLGLTNGAAFLRRLTRQ